VAGLARLLLPPTGLPRALDTIARLAPRAVAGCDSASVSLQSRETAVAMTTAGASDEVARNLDQLQLETGEGPCLDAIRTGRKVVVDTFAHDARYPSFGTLASSEGMNSCFSVPLSVDRETIGSLNLYGRRVGAYEDAADNTGVRLAEQAAVVVLAAMAHDRVEQLAEQLRAALASRAVIEQAKGIIMARSRTDADEAFEILRRASQRQNVKLREVARQIVEGAQTRPSPSA
jgi:transcriptional regulator with GAF, ATPase, and Fis domain